LINEIRNEDDEEGQSGPWKIEKLNASFAEANSWRAQALKIT
jgi:hypothetical protein